ncbi:MAG: hypothetical protein LUQ22_09440 [Methanotrichaceae archaeon]|nr:hypothetical protein [Methanotrichaceae archaeon]
MDFELHPTVSLKERSFNVLVAPREHFIEMLNRNLNLQRFKVLFVTGNFSGILSRLHRRFTELEIRRGFTTFQLMTILEEACHSLIIIEHDPILYEDSAEMVEYVSQAMKQAAHEATVLLYSPGIDPFLEDLAKSADRVFYFEEGPRDTPRLTAKTWLKMKDQKTLEAFS